MIAIVEAASFRVSGFRHQGVPRDEDAAFSGKGTQAEETLKA
jgi:hypothetical protein